MYDYKIVEQVTRKKKRLSGVLKKTMVFFAVVFAWQVFILFTGPFASGIMNT